MSRNATVSAGAGCVMLVVGRMQSKRGRVLRGGSWNNNGHNLRSAYRNHNTPDNRNHNIGLRLAGALPTPGGSTNQHPVRFRSRGAGGQIQGLRRGSRPTVETLPPGRFLVPRTSPLYRRRCGSRDGYAL